MYVAVPRFHRRPLRAPLHPRRLLGYIYAVLHAPTYRARYAEFLRIDFPRVPFPESADDFETLSGLGWALVQAHLLRELPRRKLAAYHGKGGDTVEAVRYSPEEQAVTINKTPVLQAGAASRVGFPHRRLSGARQISKIAQGPRAIARRNKSCVRYRRQPRLHHRADGEDRRGIPGRFSRPGITLRNARAGRCIGALCAQFVSSERGEFMARGSQPDLFVTESQSDLFGAEATPAYRPNPDKVRARLHKILAEARAAQTSPWEPARVSLYRTIFPQMTLWLPEDEAAQLRFEFETEMARLETA